MRKLNDIDVIDVVWEGPHTYEEVVRQKTTKVDHGLYQIYGVHPVLGPEALLYVGQAESQTFGVRISQHYEEWIKWEPSVLSFYLGRLSGLDLMTEARWPEWNEMIDRAEKLAIFFCAPAYNAQGIRALKTFGPTLVLNHGRHHRLLTEFSNLHWTCPIENPDFKPFAG